MTARNAAIGRNGLAAAPGSRSSTAFGSSTSFEPALDRLLGLREIDLRQLDLRQVDVGHLDLLRHPVVEGRLDVVAVHVAEPSGSLMSGSWTSGRVMSGMAYLLGVGCHDHAGPVVHGPTAARDQPGCRCIAAAARPIRSAHGRPPERRDPPLPQVARRRSDEVEVLLAHPGGPFFPAKRRGPLDDPEGRAGRRRGRPARGRPARVRRGGRIRAAGRRAGRLAAAGARDDRPEGRQGRPRVGDRRRPRPGSRVGLEHVRDGVAATERAATDVPRDRPRRAGSRRRTPAPPEADPDPVRRPAGRRCWPGDAVLGRSRAATAKPDGA